MDDKDKMSGSDYVNAMAELGMKHGTMMTDSMDAIQKELDAANSTEKVEHVHPIFISAGQGAYEGALRLALGKRGAVVDMFSKKQ